jgi:hypothetical protein
MDSLPATECCYNFSLMVQVLFEHEPAVLNKALNLTPAVFRAFVRKYHHIHVLRGTREDLQLSYRRKFQERQYLLVDNYFFSLN